MLSPVCLFYWNNAKIKTIYIHTKIVNFILVNGQIQNSKNGKSLNALVWLEMGITQCPCLTGMGIFHCKDLSIQFVWYNLPRY